MHEPDLGEALDNDRRREDLGPPAGTPERRGRNATDALKMRCPFCGASSSGVVRSRGAIRRDEVARRRRCAECGEKFPTSEEVDWEALQHDLARRGTTLEEEKRRRDRLASSSTATPSTTDPLLG